MPVKTERTRKEKNKGKLSKVKEGKRTEGSRKLKNNERRETFKFKFDSRYSRR
jgi:hypothetical protein